MKLSLDTRINAVQIQEVGKNVIIHSINKNMTLSEWLSHSMVDFAIDSNNKPMPLCVTEIDYSEVGSSVNDYGHRLTLLFGKKDNITSAVVKLDLAGTF